MKNIVRFNPTSKEPTRAVQAWQILVGMAKNRQTVTYEGLSTLMFGEKAAGVLSGILGHIAFYCKEHELPPLTSIVVGKGRGTPGDEIPINLSEIDMQRERVYECNWFDIYPPSEQALAESHAKRHDLK